MSHMWRIPLLSQRYFGTFLTEHRGKPYNAEYCGGRSASSEVEDIRRILEPADRIRLFYLLYTEMVERPLGPCNDGN
jgi:hypothetical protein